MISLAVNRTDSFVRGNIPVFGADSAAGIKLPVSQSYLLVN
jgi:hypothetical protein